jgi:hypothetical protein
MFLNPSSNLSFNMRRQNPYLNPSIAKRFSNPDVNSSKRDWLLSVVKKINNHLGTYILLYNILTYAVVCGALIWFHGWPWAAKNSSDVLGYSMIIIGAVYLTIGYGSRLCIRILERR